MLTEKWNEGECRHADCLVIVGVRLVVAIWMARSLNTGGDDEQYHWASSQYNDAPSKY